MEIEIILEPDLKPQQVAEIAVAAEGLGIRALWHSNYHMNPDGFLALVPAAQMTKKIHLGVLAVSPFEMHPLKIANSLLTLNEMANGRAMVAVGGGGSVAGAIGLKLDPKMVRIVRAVREAVEIIESAASGQFHNGYDGEIFKVTRPYIMAWAGTLSPQIYTCSTGAQMLRMGARVADSLMMSDVALPMVDEAMKNIKLGLEKRTKPSDNFRIANFWAWHVKADKDVSMTEARRELIWRGSLLPPYHGLNHFLSDDDVKRVIEKHERFSEAYWTRSGVIRDVPESIVNTLIAELASAGDINDLDREIDRYKKFEEAGLTDLSLRLFDDPMDALKLIGERVLPEFRR